MTYDLHCHSHFSDGKHPPEFLVERARHNGITHLAITDHDCIDAHDYALSSNDIAVIAGVEISCNWQNIEVHVVGLSIDTTCDNLRALLSEQQARRQNRICAINNKLVAAGVDGLHAYLATLNATALTRSHVADFLVETAVVRTREKAFKKFLGKKGKAYVAASWCVMQEGIAAIHEAGGIAILAHPSRYPINRTKQNTLIHDFADAGGDALECSYPNLSAEQRDHLIEAACHHNMYVSAGSDFHDAAAAWTDVGKFIPLTSELKAPCVWNHPNFSQ